jgi:hypothetical protein
VVYCRVAERSPLLWFALRELLGHPRVRHYDGGWAEYGSLAGRPGRARRLNAPAGPIGDGTVRSMSGRR